MRRKLNGEWIATSPMDLIGWDIVSEYYDDEKKVHVLQVEKNDTRKKRRVLANEAALPLTILMTKR